jgi:hypothetical protein
MHPYCHRESLHVLALELETLDCGVFRPRLRERAVHQRAIALGPYPAGQYRPKPGTPLLRDRSHIPGRGGLEPIVGPELPRRLSCDRGHLRHSQAPSGEPFGGGMTEEMAF